MMVREGVAGAGSGERLPSWVPTGDAPAGTDEDQTEASQASIETSPSPKTSVRP